MSAQYLLPTYGRQPLTFVRGDGCWLYDADDNAWLDALSGVGVNCLGHSHPSLVEAIKRQAERLIHVSNIYHIEQQEQLGQALCDAAGMEKVFFGNSGAEANEAAIKLARLYGHERGIAAPQIIVMEGAFHGRTLATLSATANPKVQKGFEPLVEGFVRVPYNDAKAVAEAAAAHTGVVAVLVEPVQGEGGVNAPDAGYLAELRRVCDQHDLLLMLDEVQTGNGRTGHYFAFQADAITPDVLTTAKGLGGGFPIAACFTSGKATGLFGPGHHGSTYGGNPLGCAAALTVIEQIKPLLPTIQQRGERLANKLREALAPFNMVQEVRQRGLMIGIPFDRDCTQLVDLARDQGLLINVTAGSVLRLLPPLIIDEADIEQLCQRLFAAINQFAQSQDES